MVNTVSMVRNEDLETLVCYRFTALINSQLYWVRVINLNIAHSIHVNDLHHILYGYNEFPLWPIFYHTVHLIWSLEFLEYESSDIVVKLRSPWLHQDLMLQIRSIGHQADIFVFYIYYYYTSNNIYQLSCCLHKGLKSC